MESTLCPMPPSPPRRADGPVIPPPASALAALFRRYFTPPQLACRLRIEPNGWELRARAYALQAAGVSLSRAAVQALRERGQVNRAFFEALLFARLDQEERIRSVAFLWFGEEALTFQRVRAARTLDANLLHALRHLTWKEQVRLAVAHGVPKALLPGAGEPNEVHALAVVDLSMIMAPESRDGLEAALRARVPAAFVT